jgi:hypothetical protein
LPPTDRAPRSGRTKITAATQSSSCASATSTTGPPCGIIPGEVRRQHRLAHDRHLTHNPLRWITQIGLGARQELVVAKTLRRTLLALPGRITRPASRYRLHLPADWPRSAWFDLALARLRCVAYAT